MPCRRLVCRPSSNGRPAHRSCCVVVFFSGLVEAFLGKAGTLHSPGQIITSALGVPPDLSGASVLGRSLGFHGRVEGIGCILAKPVGRVCLTYQAGTFPCPIVVGDHPPTRLPLGLPLFYFSRPQRGLVSTSPPPRCGQGV